MMTNSVSSAGSGWPRLSGSETLVYIYLLHLIPDGPGTTPPLVAPVPAAPEDGGFGFRLNSLLSQVVTGTTADLANQGVADTLRISRSGRSAFVIAYAVANLDDVSQGKSPIILQVPVCAIRVLRMIEGGMHTRLRPARLLLPDPTICTSKKRRVRAILSS